MQLFKPWEIKSAGLEKRKTGLTRNEPTPILVVPSSNNRQYHEGKAFMLQDWSPLNNLSCWWSFPERSKLNQIKCCDDAHNVNLVGLINTMINDSLHRSAW